MFITENVMQKRENDKIRMEIIRKVMEIYDKKSLENILYFVEAVHTGEYMQHPDTVTDIAAMMDTDDLVDAIGYLMKKNQKMRWVQQLKDAFCGQFDEIMMAENKEEK